MCWQTFKAGYKDESRVQCPAFTLNADSLPEYILYLDAHNVQFLLVLLRYIYRIVDRKGDDSKFAAQF